MKTKPSSLILLFVLTLGTLTVYAESAKATAPTVTITDIPPAGPGGEYPMEAIAGTTVGQIPEKARVAIYAYAGGQWWVQPYANNSSTSVDANGWWSTMTHLGSHYVALLVTPAFKAEVKLTDLPAVGGDVLALTKVAGK